MIDTSQSCPRNCDFAYGRGCRWGASDGSHNKILHFAGNKSKNRRYHGASKTVIRHGGEGKQEGGGTGIAAVAGGHVGLLFILIPTFAQGQPRERKAVQSVSKGTEDL